MKKHLFKFLISAGILCLSWNCLAAGTGNAASQSSAKNSQTTQLGYQPIPEVVNQGICGLKNKEELFRKGRIHWNQIDNERITDEFMKDLIWESKIFKEKSIYAYKTISMLHSHLCNIDITISQKKLDKLDGDKIFGDRYLNLRNNGDRIIEKQKNWINYDSVVPNIGGCGSTRVELWKLGNDLYFNYGSKKIFVIFKVNNDRLSYVCTYIKGK
jgi:hypothetical protein